MQALWKRHFVDDEALLGLRGDQDAVRAVRRGARGVQRALM